MFRRIFTNSSGTYRDCAYSADEDLNATTSENQYSFRRVLNIDPTHDRGRLDISRACNSLSKSKLGLSEIPNVLQWGCALVLGSSITFPEQYRVGLLILCWMIDLADRLPDASFAGPRKLDGRRNTSDLGRNVSDHVIDSEAWLILWTSDNMTTWGLENDEDNIIALLGMSPYLSFPACLSLASWARTSESNYASQRLDDIVRNDTIDQDLVLGLNALYWLVWYETASSSPAPNSPAPNSTAPNSCLADWSELMGSRRNMRLHTVVVEVLSSFAIVSRGLEASEDGQTRHWFKHYNSLKAVAEIHAGQSRDMTRYWSLRLYSGYIHHRALGTIASQECARLDMIAADKSLT